MTRWKKIEQQANELLSDATPSKSALQKICSLLRQSVAHYDWVGIYKMDPEQRRLDLLCFEGLPTEHTSIPYGKGICGQVAESGEALFVDDILLEDNYISCNVLVRSEVVYPIFSGDRLVAQLDIDSNKTRPFGTEDRKLIGRICEQIGENWPLAGF